MGRAPPSPIGRLMNELLSSILLQVKLDSSPSFLACLLCCKTWHSVGLRLLYHDLLLTNSNLETFVKNFNHVLCGSLVRSLTLCIVPVQPDLQPNAPHPYAFLEDMDHMRRHGNQGSKRLWGLLKDVSGKIATMIRLMTFSLYVSPEPRNGIGFWIPRPIIAKVIETLPESCVNLEIDTRGHDYSEPGSAHVTLSEECFRISETYVFVSVFCVQRFLEPTFILVILPSIFPIFSQWLHCLCKQ